MSEQTVTRQHLAGLELALAEYGNGGPGIHFAHRMNDLIHQASAAPEQESTDFIIDAFRESPKGGWDTSTPIAVRITHVPTGLSATSSEGRSQHQNKVIAMDRLEKAIFAVTAPEQKPVAWMKESGEVISEETRRMLEDGVGKTPFCYPLYTHADPAEVERLRAALKFYADREHYHFESDNWDSVSGEPSNILWHSEDPDFIEDGEVARAALSACAQPSDSWIKVADRLPDNEVHVLAFFPSKQRAGFYVRANSISTENRPFDGDADYDEASDSLYWPAGWYFFEDGMDMWMAPSENPTHWMPLPAAPAQPADGVNSDA